MKAVQMTELLTAAQMKAIEAAAIANGEVTGLELMERAGAGVVAAVFEEWPELRAGSFRAVVLCGPGNNGGDGFVVARLLKEWGWEVHVFLYGDAAKLPPDARVNYERWVAMGEVGVADYDSVKRRAPYDLRVDAVFGTGLARLPSKSLGRAFEAARTVWRDGGEYRQAKRVAVDCPSCLDLDSGRTLFPRGMFEGDMFLDYFANLTVTFHRLKVGHMLVGEWDYCQNLKVVDIGLEPGRTEPVRDNGETAERGVAADRVTLLEKTEPAHPSDAWPASQLWKGGSGHKFSYGHALILSGPPSYTGAARMSSRGALRIGAGLVTLACPPEALAENAAHLTAVMLEPVADGAGLTEILTDTRINALCLGPGLGLDARAAGLVAAALGAVGEDRAAPRRLVLDADALSLISRDPALFAGLHPGCVLTPHGGEFARLFPDIADKLAAPATKGPAYSKVDATREAAVRANCVVLFKGPDTVIASPDGTCAINSAAYDRAAPWLATAGSGDVLAGFITGLLARGFAPQQAAETAAWLHVECARSYGPGLIAEDLPEELPKVFRALGL
jgi:hydroxyethylthiazole kinase-like uncharacterized protein yjeF